MPARFSIVLTCHNQRDFIVDAVRSALSQTLAGAEVIVVDDGSGDASAEVLKQYEHDVRLVLLPTNQGAIAARNLGASLATGEYLAFLDGDDALMPWALEVYERIVEARHPMLILGRRQWVEGSIPDATKDRKPSKIEIVNYDRPLLKDRTAGLGASTFVVLRQAFQDVGGWTPDIFHLDLQDLVTKLAYAGPLSVIREPRTAFYRIHAGNSIHTVPPFLRSLHLIMAKERAGLYPGGGQHRFERRAWLGGLTACWIRRAVDAHLYRDALMLAVSGWWMIVAALARRCDARIVGRRPIETIELNAP